MVCSTLETEARSEYAGGDFLPLSVYAARGFDTKRIEQFTPEHLKKEDAVLGMCYKVDHRRIEKQHGQSENQEARAEGHETAS